MVLKFLRKLDADDIFISYSRADGEAYLTGLDAALSELDFACFNDKRGTESNPLPPEMLVEKARLSKTLVLLGTAGALAQPQYIDLEVKAFAEANGTARIVPISFDRNAGLQDWSNTPWYPQVVGKTRERELPDALKTGTPSPTIVSDIAKLSNYMKAKDRLRMYRNRAVVTLSVLILASIAASIVAFYMMNRANKARALADREQAIASARELANRSQTLLRQRPEALQRSIALAIQAVTTAANNDGHTVEVDSALRESLALLAVQDKHVIYTGKIIATALSPDARHFTTANDDDVLRVFNAGEPNPVKTYKGISATNIAISNDAAMAAAVWNDMVKIYNLTKCSGDGKNPCAPQRTIKLNKSDVEGFSADDEEYLDIRVEQVALSPKGRYLAMIKSVDDTGTQSGVADIENAINDATLYDLKSGREIKSLSRGQRHHDITFSAEGDLAIGAGLRLRSEFSGFSGTVLLWNLSQKLQPDENKGSLVPDDFIVETFPQRREVMSVALAGKFGLLATERAIWRRNDVGMFTASAYFPLPEGAEPNISEVAFTADGKELAAVRSGPSKGVASSNLAIADRAVEFWSTGEQPDAGHTFLDSADSNLSFLADNRTVILGQTKQVTFDIANGMQITSAVTPDESNLDRSIKILGSAGRLAVVTDKKQIYVFDGLQTHNAIIPLPEEFPNIDRVKAAISEDGKFLALACKEYGSELVKVMVYVFSGSGYRLHHLQTLRDSTTLHLYTVDWALTPDGARLVTLSDNIVNIWDLQSGKDITTQPLLALSTPAAINEVNAIELSPAGTYLAVAYTRTALEKDSEGNIERDPEDEYGDALLLKPDNIVVVRLSDGVAVNRIEHSARIKVMAFSGHENYLLTASARGLTVLVRPDAIQSAQTIRSDSEVSSVSFSADERYLALGAKEGTRVLLTGEPQSEIAFLPDTGEVTEIVFSPDGKLLATRSNRESTSFQNSDENYPLRVWCLAPNDLLADAKRRLAAIPDDLRQPPS